MLVGVILFHKINSRVISFIRLTHNISLQLYTPSLPLSLPSLHRSLLISQSFFVINQDASLPETALVVHSIFSVNDALSLLLLP